MLLHVTECSRYQCLFFVGANASVRNKPTTKFPKWTQSKILMKQFIGNLKAKAILLHLTYQWEIPLIGDAPEQFKSRCVYTISFSLRFARLSFWLCAWGFAQVFKEVSVRETHLWEHFGRKNQIALRTCLKNLNVSGAFLNSEMAKCPNFWCP